MLAAVLKLLHYLLLLVVNVHLKPLDPLLLFLLLGGPLTSLVIR